jgi:hypothetical protein
MINRLLVFLALVASSMVVGYFIAWHKYSNSPADGYAKLVISNPLLVSDKSKSEGSPAASTTIADVLSLAPGFQQYLGSHLFANGLDEQEIQSGIVDALQIKPDHMAYELTKILIARYVEVDPKAALEFLHSQLTPGSPDYPNLLFVLYREIALRDAQLAWTSIGLIPSLRDRQSVKTWLLTKGVISSPEMLAELKSDLTMQERQRLSYVELSGQPPEELFRSALELRDGQERSQKITMAISRWAEQDPEAAFNAVDSLTDENLKYASYQMIFHHWAAKDVESALLAAESLEDPRKHHLGSVLGVLAREDPVAALQVAERHAVQGENNLLLRQVVSGWAATDPAAAAAYVESLDEYTSSELIHTVAMAYLNQSPEAAFDWVAEVGGSNSPLLTMIGQQYVSQYPDAAKQKIDSLPFGPTRDSLISMYVGVKAQSDPLNMLSWIRQFEDEDIYQNVHGQVISGWLNKDPEGAADYVQSLQNGPFKQQKMMELVGRWSHMDTDRAIKVLQEMDSDLMKDQGLNMIALSVARRNWEQAMEFVDDINNENVQKDARMNVIMQVSQIDRQRAIQLLSEYKLADDPRSAMVTNTNQFGRGFMPRFMYNPDVVRSMGSGDGSVQIIQGSEAIRIESSD